MVENIEFIPEEEKDLFSFNILFTFVKIQRYSSLVLFLDFFISA
jgi:hypothetical protein